MISDRNQTYHVFHSPATWWKDSRKEKRFLLVGWNPWATTLAPRTSTFYYVLWSGSQRGWSSLSRHNLEIKQPINPLVSFEAYNLFSDISVPCLADLQTFLPNCV